MEGSSKTYRTPLKFRPDLSGEANPLPLSTGRVDTAGQARDIQPRHSAKTPSGRWISRSIWPEICDSLGVSLTSQKAFCAFSSDKPGKVGNAQYH